MLERTAEAAKGAEDEGLISFAMQIVNKRGRDGCQWVSVCHQYRKGQEPVRSGCGPLSFLCTFLSYPLDTRTPFAWVHGCMIYYPRDALGCARAA